ncbi:HpcH/HpaI aldolase family protein [Amycolatopsis jiangsuensis]|uniref:4-hydroxy-2-oxoheptanedioate aldolase n=1 Tax=Amycolatopsis jiangsuensis TaxID=1181879 RepID=A0A840IQ01_9PSEU|nr:aldolase/citrate lyase family protein [Amycolatopsis jiangsuensis]MBB4683457.1 4-hydroxy-2-oxoheptanedioate aldolase [Amycolatopsis jiangsuensis]
MSVTFKERIARHEELVGALVRLPSELLIDLAGFAELDFVLIDLEHGPGDTIPLQAHLAQAHSQGLATLVRIDPSEPQNVLRALDLGATGIIFPHVSTVEQAQHAVRLAHYPPLGARGFATYSRAGRYGQASTSEHLANMAERTCVFVMIEDTEGVASAAGIMAVEGVDGVMVGPADLGVSMGGRPADDPEVRSLLRQVHAVSKAQGKAVLSIVGNRAAARSAFADGSELVVYNTQQVMMQAFLDLADVKSGRGTNVNRA